MSEFAYLASISLVLGTILLVFGMKYLSAARQARSRVISEDAYRELAQKAVAAQSDNATSLSSIQSGLFGGQHPPGGGRENPQGRRVVSACGNRGRQMSLRRPMIPAVMLLMHAVMFPGFWRDYVEPEGD